VTPLRRLYARAVDGPAYPPNEADLADVRLFGLALPRRASVVIVVTIAVLLLDQLGIPGIAELLAARLPGLDPTSGMRFLLFLAVPVGLVIAGFRDDPGRYGLRLGDWRWGAGLLFGGLLVMTPIILALSAQQGFRDYYGSSAEPLEAAAGNNLVELIPAEFLLRGFLMFALWRRIGPLALIVQLFPFVLTHLGKPEIELWSTFIGGSVFAWLDWRTGSILWSALGHVYVLTLMRVAVGGATLS
jgi:membrane protease YdiL (CAAX protease family)